jgi:hypothetical protein
MKRSFLILLGIGIVLSLSATPVLAAETEATAVSSKPVSWDFMIGATEKQTCTADQDCPYDDPVHCEGTSCLVRPHAVVCDGVWTWCQCAAAPLWCYDPLCYCICKDEGSSDTTCRLQCCKEPYPWPPDP